MIAWTPFKHHDMQQQMIKDHLQFLRYQMKGELCPNHVCPRVITAVAGRGSGKTDIWRKLLITELKYKKPWLDPIFIYAMPTYGQAERVAWEPILKLIPRDWVAKNGINIQKQTIKTIFGSTLYIAGLDKPNRIEGLQIDGIVIDESSDIKPGIFDKSIRPMLSHRHAWVARIGVPKRSGVGRVEYKHAFDRGMEYRDDTLLDTGEKTNDNLSNVSNTVLDSRSVVNDSSSVLRQTEQLEQQLIRVKSYHWVSESVIPQAALEEAKSEMTLEDYNEQYRAQWVEAGGGIYYAFGEENISETVFYDPARPLIVGCDFNVSPMAWVVGQEFESPVSTSDSPNKSLHLLNEIFLKNTNTQKTLVRLREMYPNHREFTFYGDASSRARKTAAAKTDYIQVKTSPLFPHSKAFFPQRNPALVDRWTTTNIRMCNANGERNLLIHPRCKHLIRDYREVSFKEGTRERENYDGTDIGHCCDASDYIIYRRYPLRVHSTSAPIVIVA